MSVPSFLPESIKNLQKAFSRLPGVGEKTAMRFIFYLLSASQDEIKEMMDSLRSLIENIRLCSVCFNVIEGVKCPICSDHLRDKTLICVVENIQDFISIERSGEYKGLYHVLMGKISPLKGITQKDLTINKLLERCSKGDIKEVLIATNVNTEGETTALYIKKQIEGMNIKVTRLAVGIPVGGEIEYLDPATISKAIKNRMVI